MRIINRAVCGTVAVIGVIAIMAGVVICMCETPEFADQLRNMLVGLGLIAIGALIAYIGGAGRWLEGPYAEL